MSNENSSGVPENIPQSDPATIIYSSVPFSVDLGVTTIQGVAAMTSAGITLEWRIYDLLDTPRGPMESLGLSYGSIVTINLKKRFWGSRLTILCKSPRDLEKFPLPAGAITELNCYIRRKHRQQAEHFVADGLMRLAELT